MTLIACLALIFLLIFLCDALATLKKFLIIISVAYFKLHRSRLSENIDPEIKALQDEIKEVYEDEPTDLKPSTPTVPGETTSGITDRSSDS